MEKDGTLLPRAGDLGYAVHGPLRRSLDPRTHSSAPSLYSMDVDLLRQKAQRTAAYGLAARAPPCCIDGGNGCCVHAGRWHPFDLSAALIRFGAILIVQVCRQPCQTACDRLPERPRTLSSEQAQRQCDWRPILSSGRRRADKHERYRLLPTQTALAGLHQIASSQASEATLSPGTLGNACLQEALKKRLGGRDRQRNIDVLQATDTDISCERTCGNHLPTSF